MTRREQIVKQKIPIKEIQEALGFKSKMGLWHALKKNRFNKLQNEKLDQLLGIEPKTLSLKSNHKKNLALSKRGRSGIIKKGGKI